MKKILCITMIVVSVICVGCDSVQNRKENIDTTEVTNTTDSGTTESELMSKIETTTDDQSVLMEERYKDILDKYYQALSESWDMQRLADNGLCYLCMYYEGLSDIGYTFIDIDNNGVRELLIGEMNAEGAYVGMFFDMYTIVNDEVVLVTSSGERDRYYLCEDYTIANEASGGAESSMHAYYNLTDNKKLELIEVVVYDGICYDKENPWFYSTTGLSEEDYNTNPITEDTAIEIKDKYEYMKIEFVAFEEYK